MTLLDSSFESEEDVMRFLRYEIPKAFGSIETSLYC